MTPRGLYDKYDVFKAGTDERVTDCFVLRYDRDRNARTALRMYAACSLAENPKLAADIQRLLDGLERLK